MDAGRDDVGAATAESAAVLPVLVLFAVSLVWLLTLGATQVRAIDAASETARAAARSEDAATARALGHRVAPEGSTIRVRRAAGTVVVSVTSPVPGPAGLFRAFGHVRIKARAVAAEEPVS